MTVRKVKLFVAVACMALVMSGCMYPNEMKKQNQVAVQEYVLLAQNAVDQFHTKTGVLPIQNSDETTPIYEKYRIDFRKLKDRGFMSTIPANAFENGGTNIFVIVDAETKPTVKLMDLNAYQQTVEVQRLLDGYKSKHGGELPKGAEAGSGLHYIDFAKLGVKDMAVPSVYTRQQTLPFLVTDSGQAAIDYAAEIMRLIDKKGLQSSLKPDQDLRQLLVADSYYVPARSYPYYWKNNQPTPAS